jgi:hypothetical protein
MQASIHEMHAPIQVTRAPVAGMGSRVDAIRVRLASMGVPVAGIHSAGLGFASALEPSPLLRTSMRIP